MAHQTDLFGHEPAQSELFGSPLPTLRSVPVTPNGVRGKMLTMLAQLRAADRMPWPERKLRINEVIFPQMANWLPDEEASQLCFAFTQEIERLKQAA